jgi:hypothetical protein
MVRGTFLTAALLLAGCATQPTPPEAESAEPISALALISETPKTADAFVNSIGVNTKLTYLQSVYGSGFSSIVLPKLVSLGVTHVRDEGPTAKSDGWMNEVYGRMRALSDRGIKFNLIMKPAEGVTDYTKIYSWDRFLKWALPVVEDFEGLNEWDYKCRCTDWAAKTRNFQKALYTQVKSDSRTAGRPVFAPSMGNPNNAALVGDLSAYLNYGNLHPYPGGGQPMANMAYHTVRVDDLSKTRPWVVTESGYHNAMQWFGGHPPVSERASSHYIPRLYLEYFAAGIRRSYLTELMDEGVSTDNRELNFGLVRNNGAIKPAYKALQNLIAVLKDPGPAFNPSSLSYSLGGDQTSLQRILLQKRNGVYYLALWQGVASYDLVNRKDLFPANRTVTVSFSSAVSSVRIFDPMASATAKSSVSRPTTVSVSVPDYPVIVEITR